jgi:7-carboxy-7-deazaguanine synthase
MNRNLNYTVVEVFESVQGEGLRSGIRAVFVRLAGCNLRCPWCDTPEALTAAGHRVIGLEELLNEIGGMASARYVVLTGGEPALQELTPLVERLHAAGFEVGIETNGTLDIPPAIDWVTLSPKPPVYFVEPAVGGRASELKLVVDDQLDIETVRKLWTAVGRHVPLVLQPENNRPEMIGRIIDWLKQEPQWRLGIQLHKVLGLK